MLLKVDRHISGSYCVIYKNKEHYIDCRKFYVYDTEVTYIECVLNGQVYKRLKALNTEAPEIIINLIKELFLCRT